MSDNKWQRIYQELRERIESGEYPVGSRFPAIAELSRRYAELGSGITIRRAYDELKREGWLTAREKRGTFVTEPVRHLDIYLCNKRFDSDVAGHSAPIQRFYQVMQRFAGDITWSITPVTVEEAMADAGRIKSPMIVFFSSFVDATADSFQINHERIAFFRKHFDPLVFDACEGIDGMHQIRNDRYAAFRNAVRILVERGHRRIAFLAQGLTLPGVRERLHGYIDGMAEAGVLVDASWIRSTPRNCSNEVNEAMSSLLSMTNPPTAVICANDYKALNVMAFCRKHGISVPGQLSVIGFDDIPESAEANPPLSTFSLLSQETGRAIMEYVKIHRIGGAESPMISDFTPIFVDRESVKNKEN